MRLTTGYFIFLISLGLAPAACAQDAPTLSLSGTVVVANKRGNDASFIDLESGKIVATAPTGNGPHELVVSPDGRLAVVTDYGGGRANTLTVLDIATASVVRTIDRVRQSLYWTDGEWIRWLETPNRLLYKERPIDYISRTSLEGMIEFRGLLQRMRG